MDGRTAFIGGANVGDEYLNRDRHLNPWRDTHLELQGPSVHGAQLSFIEDWYWALGEVPELNGTHKGKVVIKGYWYYLQGQQIIWKPAN